MAIYIGFWAPVDEYWREVRSKVRGGQPTAEANEPMLAKTRALPQVLPEGCKLVGSYNPIGISGADRAVERFPGVMLIETDDPAHLGVITQHYLGFLSFAFHPYNPVGRT